MTKFDYVIKIKELESLTTKKSKVDFIGSLRLSWDDIGNFTQYNLLLMDKARIKLLPEKISGAAGLRHTINDNIRMVNGSMDELDQLEKTAITGSNDYNAFMYSSGIPAYLKMAVLKAQV